MRVFGRLLGWLFGLLLVVALGGYFFLQDANRLKPELEALIAENSAYQASLDGNIRWQLFPPLQLKMHDVTLIGAEENISAGSVELKMDLSAIWQDTNQWRISALYLTDASYEKDGAITQVSSMEVIDFRLSQPADFTVDLSHAANNEAQPLPLKLAGTVIYTPATTDTGQRIELQRTRVQTDMARGICDADITEVQNPSPATPSAEDELLPLSTLNNYDLSAQCTFDELVLEEETFTNAKLDITNIAGQLNVLMDLPDFLDGTLITDVEVDTHKTPIEWTVLPEIDSVDSQRLVDLTSRNMQWIAAIAFNSKIKLYGNTAEALANSVSATSEFDGGQGQLNIAKIKAQLMNIAAITRQVDEVSDWPDVWDYQEFVGRWQINGPVHDLKFALDNMSVDANGTYDYASDTIDMLANVIINEGDNSPFRINPILEGTPIPVRCAGPSQDPKCQLDENAAKTLVARALRSGDDSGLRRKLEEKIDEEVPEEYRDTARSLLDILGRALENN